MSVGWASHDRSLVTAAVVWTVVVNLLAFAASPIAETLFVFVIVPTLAVAVTGMGMLVWAVGVMGRRLARRQPLGVAPYVLGGLLIVGAIGYAGEWNWLAQRGDALAAHRRLASEVEGYDEIVSDLRAGTIEMPGSVGMTEQIRGVRYSVLSTAPLRVAFLEPVGFVTDPTEWMVYDPSGAVQHKGAVARGTKFAGDFTGCIPMAHGYFRCWTN